MIDIKTAKLRLLQRFWSKINKKGIYPKQYSKSVYKELGYSAPKGRCWEWTAGLHSSGYGIFSFEGKNILAHRFAWFIKYATRPKLHVLYKCDNPLCIRWTHLFLGNQAANLRDMVIKGRAIYVNGESVTISKLTEVQVLEIRAKSATGKYTQKELAKKFGVGETAIFYIVSRYTWKHLQEAVK